MNLQYIDMHDLYATMEICKKYPWLVRYPHGKMNWGYVVIDTDKDSYDSFVGYITITNYKTTFSNTTKRIKEFYISKEYRGRGIGNKLMQLAIARNVYIVTASPNPDYEPDHINALHLYEKYGFVCKQTNSKRYKKVRFVNLYRVSLEPRKE